MDTSNKKHTGGIGHKIEELPGLGAFAKSTGGDEYQRLYRSNYCKKAHAQSDAESKELFGANISAPRVVGGVGSD